MTREFGQQNDTSGVPTPLNQPCKYCKTLELDDASYGGQLKSNNDGVTFLDFGQVTQTKEDRIREKGQVVELMRKAASHCHASVITDGPEIVPRTENQLDYTRSDRLPELPEIDRTASAGCVFCNILRHDLIASWKSIAAKWDEDKKVEKEDDVDGGLDADDWEEKYDSAEDSEDEGMKKKCEEQTEEAAKVTDKNDEGEEDEKDEKFEEASNIQNVRATSKATPMSASLLITEVTYKFEAINRYKEGPQKTWLDALYVFFTIECEGEIKDYSLRYNIYADKADPCASWLGIKRYSIMNDQLSTPSLNRLNELIRLSEEEHPVQVEKEPWLPTRLLDLKAGGQTGVRLVITQDDREISGLESHDKRYAALSYCWGSEDASKKQLKTTKDTLKDHLVSIPIGKSPQTVADSIELCRSLGIRFLWVDALCIIQENPEDWSKESYQMSKIYENSFLTLCITRGDSCTAGFLVKEHAPSAVKIKFQSNVDSSISGHFSIRMLLPPALTVRRCTVEDGKYGNSGPSSPGDMDLEYSAWGERGWTFQEDQLAPRRVYFGNLMFHVSRGSQLEAADGSSISRHRFLENVASQERGLSTWYSMVSEYSGRNLSVQQDKFPAIAALARVFGERFPGQQYLAGLWESDLHKGLLWTYPGWMEFEKYRELLPKDYTAPSWSWARRPLKANWLLTDSEHPSSEMILRGTDIITDKFNRYGRVSKGRLFLTARMFKPPARKNGKLRIKHSFNYFKFLTVPCFNYVLISEKREYMAQIIFEWDSHSALNDKGYPRGPVSEISLLLTASLNPEDYSMLKSRDLPDDQELLLGIVVRPSPEEGAYEKLGLWFTEDRGVGGRKFWKDVPMQDITLV